MQDIFREMGATYSLLYPEQSGLRTPSSTSVLVARAVAYLQTHYQDPTLTTAQLAQELYASREHLSRAFKECTMESIHNYLTYLRMQHCRKALEEGVSVLNACTESGFPDYSSFLKAFRRLYGITPAEYRAQPGQWCVKSCGRRIRKFFSKRVDILPALWYYT